MMKNASGGVNIPSPSTLRDGSDILSMWRNGKKWYSFFQLYSLSLSLSLSLYIYIYSLERKLFCGGKNDRKQPRILVKEKKDQNLMPNFSHISVQYKEAINGRRTSFFTKPIYFLFRIFGLLFCEKMKKELMQFPIQLKKFPSIVYFSTLFSSIQKMLFTLSDTVLQRFYCIYLIGN